MVTDQKMLTTAVNHSSLVPPPQSFVTPPQLRAKKLYIPQLSSLTSIHKTVIYHLTHNRSFTSVQSCLSSSFSTERVPRFNPSTRLFVSGLSFRTTEESLRNAFKNYGELVEVNMVMDKIANRPRGFAFLRYASAEESNKAIEGMHGKFLDGRVIFVEVAKSRAELRKEVKNQQ